MVIIGDDIVFFGEVCLMGLTKDAMADILSKNQRMVIVTQIGGKDIGSEVMLRIALSLWNS
jgi:hypothetical protein